MNSEFNTTYENMGASSYLRIDFPEDTCIVDYEVGMIVSKAVNMAQMMNVPILGIVENMSYLTCPDCKAKYSLVETQLVGNPDKTGSRDRQCCNRDASLIRHQTPPSSRWPECLAEWGTMNASCHPVLFQG